MEVVVIGVGRIGSVAACCLANAGHIVTGIEVNPNNLQIMNSGAIPYHEPDLDGLLDSGLETSNLKFAAVLPGSFKADVVMIAVNTPAMADGSCDLSYIHAAVAQVRDALDGPTIMVMKSTVPPGTGMGLVKEYLQGTAITYVSNPEFLRGGRGVYDWNHPDRIVIGADDNRAADKVRLMYSGIQAPVLLTDITSAEMIKYASNTFLATKISFINEIANICDAVGANIDDVARGMGLDPRIGPAFLQAGLGYGGHCLPKDAAALNCLASSKGYDFRILRAAMEVNARQRTIVIDKLKQLLGSLKGKEIALLGLAFKPGTSDASEAPALDIARQLITEGAKIRAYDPAATENARSLLPDGAGFAEDVYSAAAGACAIVLTTEWPEFIEADWTRIKDAMVEPYAIVDGRNALPSDRLVAAGFKYSGVGRKTA
ncbi:MAG: UDP-glucose/GDP-mannose dehydrogenase family protein [Dehalococcoidia bacterium]